MKMDERLSRGSLERYALVEYIKARRGEGWSYEQIADETEYSEDTVGALAREYGIVRTPQHGELKKFRDGCRCDLCMVPAKAEKERMNRARADRKLRLGDAPHGTVSGYVNWGCRCDPCKAAGKTNNDKGNSKYHPPVTGIRRRRWTAEEDAALVAGGRSVKEFAVDFDRSVPAIHMRRGKLGLTV